MASNSSANYDESSHILGAKPPSSGNPSHGRGADGEQTSAGVSTVSCSELMFLVAINYKIN